MEVWGAEPCHCHRRCLPTWWVSAQAEVGINIFIYCLFWAGDFAIEIVIVLVLLRSVVDFFTGLHPISAHLGLTTSAGFSASSSRALFPIPLN